MERGGGTGAAGRGGGMLKGQEDSLMYPSFPITRECIGPWGGQRGPWGQLDDINCQSRRSDQETNRMKAPPTQSPSHFCWEAPPPANQIWGSLSGLVPRCREGSSCRVHLLPGAAKPEALLGRELVSHLEVAQQAFFGVFLLEDLQTMARGQEAVAGGDFLFIEVSALVGEGCSSVANVSRAISHPPLRLTHVSARSRVRRKGSLGPSKVLISAALLTGLGCR